jgi:DNA-binding response OmpR family regulator
MDQTILVVEDDDVLRQILGRVLRQQGYIVRFATTVAQALERAGESDLHLVLLDLCLPDGNGADLARDLKIRNAHLPLLLMTAYPLRLRDDATGAALFECVLTKPLHLQELRRAVRAALTSSAVAVPQGREAAARLTQTTGSRSFP